MCYEGDTALKELDFLDIDGAYGGNQYWARRPMMNLGGCSTVCACHAAAFLARRGDGREALCPFEEFKITKKQFMPFFREMFKYVFPGKRGMPKLSLFEAGFSNYARAKGCEVSFELLEGDEPYEKAAELVRRAIDEGYPPQFLLLEHYSDAIDDIEWHWFTITGYETRADGGMTVAFSTWGERREIDLFELWDNRRDEKGGVLVVR